ncbi:MAG TPA: PfkB family carbohydrate kinase [bacterium]|nr:PfkB family carbohydrate kinase [bacterium]
MNPKLKTGPYLDPVRLGELLKRIGRVRVAVIGDLCLDIYWLADLTRSELSRETPHFPLPVIEERFSPGGGANVAANLAALGAARVTVLGLVGRDWRAGRLRAELVRRAISTAGLCAGAGRVTPAYVKPVRRGSSGVEYEDPRLDFDNYAPPTAAEEARLIRRLERTWERVDALCVSDQLRFGSITPGVRARLIELARSGRKPVVIDSRDRIAGFTGPAILKPNELEAFRALSGAGRKPSLDPADRAGLALGFSALQKARVFMTAGAEGAFFAADGRVEHLPAVPAAPPLDIVGAGDAFLAALTLALAAGASGAEAAQLGNLAAAVVIRKLKTTGTASPAELLRKLTSMEKP